MVNWQNQIIYQHLYPKQKECLDFFNQDDNSKLSLLSTGCGKTITCLSWAENKLLTNPSLNKILIVCPACKTLDWFVEVEQWQKQGSFVGFKPIKLNKIKTNWDLINTNEKQICVISHQMFQQFYKNKKLVEYKNLWPKCCIIFDEAAILKSVSSTTFKTMWSISKIMHHTNCIYATATPHSNKQSEVFALLKLVGVDFGYGDNIYMDNQVFKDYYFNFKTQTIFNPFKHQHIEIKTELGPKPEKEQELYNLVHLQGFTMTLKEVRGSSQQATHSIKYIENPAALKTTKLIKAMMFDAIKTNYQKDKLKPVSLEYQPLHFVMPANAIMYERQLCSGFLSNKQIPDFKPISFANPKLDYLQSMLENTQDNVVIFYNFQQECDDIETMIKKQLPDKKIIIVNGSNKFEKSKALIDSITKPDNYVMIAHYLSAGIGVNLQHFSNIEIFYSLPLGLIDFTQAKGRISRIGQEKDCLYYYFITKGTIEEEIYETLLNNQSYTEKLYQTKNNIL